MFIQLSSASHSTLLFFLQTDVSVRSKTSAISVANACIDCGDSEVFESNAILFRSVSLYDF